MFYSLEFWTISHPLTRKHFHSRSPLLDDDDDGSQEQNEDHQAADAGPKDQAHVLSMLGYLQSTLGVLTGGCTAWQGGEAEEEHKDNKCELLFGCKKNLFLKKWWMGNLQVFVIVLWLETRRVMFIYIQTIKKKNLPCWRGCWRGKWNFTNSLMWMWRHAGVYGTQNWHLKAFSSRVSDRNVTHRNLKAVHIKPKPSTVLRGPCGDQRTLGPFCIFQFINRYIFKTDGK